MREQAYKTNTARMLAMLILLALWLSEARAASSGSVSHWLNRETIPALREMLGQHPRYLKQRIQIAGVSGDALSEAIVARLVKNLTDLESIHLVEPDSGLPLATTIPLSIDALDCQAKPLADYLLQVRTHSQKGATGEVEIALVDLHDQTAQAVTWQWRGRLSSKERAQLGKPAQHNPAGGSLAIPWPESAVASAARALSRQLACSLRPQVRTRLSLHWPREATLPAVFADTVNASRHMLGAYREIGFADESAEYRMEVRVEPFMGDTWQLWLAGKPRNSALAPVQAVTYFKVANLQWPARVAADFPAHPSEAKPPQRRAAPPVDLGEPLTYLDVELLSSRQTDRPGSKADLEVTLSIGNRADWPIEYSFSLSGGHFNHCVARPRFYRHDRYGTLKGIIEAGDRVVRRLVVRNAKHRPTPWYGMRQCAGFLDLDGFEEFASRGHKVIDYVRWEM